jgi:hypothetical protein
MDPSDRFSDLANGEVLSPVKEQITTDCSSDLESGEVQNPVQAPNEFQEEHPVQAPIEFQEERAADRIRNFRGRELGALEFRPPAPGPVLPSRYLLVVVAMTIAVSAASNIYGIFVAKLGYPIAIVICFGCLYIWIMASSQILITCTETIIVNPMWTGNFFLCLTVSFAANVYGIMSAMKQQVIYTNDAFVSVFAFFELFCLNICASIIYASTQQIIESRLYNSCEITLYGVFKSFWVSPEAIRIESDAFCRAIKPYRGLSILVSIISGGAATLIVITKNFAWIPYALTLQIVNFAVSKGVLDLHCRTNNSFLTNTVSSFALTMQATFVAQMVFVIIDLFYLTISQ